MYVVANFVGMEFNIFNFLWIISHSFFFLRWGMTGYKREVDREYIR
jgi:hypothetical protein